MIGIMVFPLRESVKDVGSMRFVELYLRMEIGGDVDCHLALEEIEVADCCIILPS